MEVNEFPKNQIHLMFCADTKEKLLVKPSQWVLWIEKGRLRYILEEGIYLLSDFSSELSSVQLIYLSAKIILDQRFGTATPIVVKQPNGELVSVRAFGSYTYGLLNPKTFYKKLLGDQPMIQMDDLALHWRPILLGQLTQILSQTQKTAPQLQEVMPSLSQDLLIQAQPVFQSFGFNLKSCVIQSISSSE